MTCSNSPGARRRRNGFTMVELLVGMVLTGIIAGVLLQFLRGQTRFVAFNNARQEVLQNAQGTLEIIGSDLRSVHPSGIISAEANAITLAVPRAWGVVCSGGGGTLSAVFPSSVPTAAFSIPPVTAGGSFVGLMVGAGPNKLPARGATMARVTGASFIANPTVSGSPCQPIFPQAAAGVTAVTFSGSDIPVVPTTMTADPVVLYQLARYDVGTTTDGAMVRRSNGALSSMQPLAGPLFATEGLRFTYYNAAGAPLGIPTGAAINEVRRIKIAVSMQSTSRVLGNTPDIQRDSVIITLRNQ